MNLSLKCSIFLLLFTGLFLSCVHEADTNCPCQPGDFEYLIFGTFYGECGGEGCIEIFKVDNNALYEDSNDFYPNFQYPCDCNFIRLPDEKFAIVRDIVDDFPDELFSESAHVIGIPDGGDWGGAYVEYSRFGQQPQFWLLDQMDTNMPQVYNDFVDRINEKITLIHQ